MTEWSRVALCVCAPAFFLVPGLVLSAGLPRKFLNAAGPARIAWAWLLGTAWMGVGSFVASFLLGLSLRRTTFVLIAFVPVLAGAITLPFREPRSGGGLGTVWRRFGWASGFLVAWTVLVTLTLMADSAVSPTSDFDGRMTWGPIARYMRAERSVLPRALSDAACYVSHPQYPPLVPLLRVALEETFDLPWDDRCTRPLYAWFFPAFTLVLFDVTRRWAGRRAAMGAVFAATLVSPLTFDLNGGPAGTYSDLPLALFYGGAVMMGLAARGCTATASLSGLLFCAAALTKNEGVPLALIGALLLLCRAVGPRVSSRSRTGGRWWKNIGMASVPLAGASLMSVLLFAWRARIPNRFDEDYAASLLRLETFRAPLARLVDAAGPIVRECTKLNGWGPLLLVVVFLVVSRPRGVLSPRMRILAVLCMAPLLIGMLAYAIPGWDVRELVEATWNRLLTQASIPLLTGTAVLLRPWMLRGGVSGLGSPSWRSRGVADASLDTPGSAP